MWLLGCMFCVLAKKVQSLGKLKTDDAFFKNLFENEKNRYVYILYYLLIFKNRNNILTKFVE